MSKITMNRWFVVILVMLAFTLLGEVYAFAAPAVSTVTGQLQNGSVISVTGSGFGTQGPNIVIFDDFEGGVNGNTIMTGTGSATVGHWDRVGGGDNSNPPHYSNRYSVSGGLAFKGDATKQTNTGYDSNSCAFIDNINATEIYMSYWEMWPTTSSFPCYNGGICNIKNAWVYNSVVTGPDRTVFSQAPADANNLSDTYFFCNACSTGEHHFSPDPTIQKGKWYRYSAWISASVGEQAWILSPASQANIAIGSPRVNFSGTVEPGPFQHVSLNAYDRWCNNCTESSPFFDDVYVATGPGARARVEIGDASTYTACKNLTIATVNTWSDAAISATIHQGSFTNLSAGYVYVTDASGNVNSTGYPLSSNRPMPPQNVR